jgi:threonine synthase
MWPFGTNIKDNDLLNIVAMLKQIQEIRDGMGTDPAVLLEGYNRPTGTRKDTYMEVVGNVLKERTTPIVARLEATVKKLR